MGSSWIVSSKTTSCLTSIIVASGNVAFLVVQSVKHILSAAVRCVFQNTCKHNKTLRLQQFSIFLFLAIFELTSNTSVLEQKYNRLV